MREGTGNPLRYVRDLRSPASACPPDHQRALWNPQDSRQGESTARRDDAPDILKDLDGVVIRPVVNDTLHQIGTGPFGYGVEEATTHDLTACSDIARQDRGAPATTCGRSERVPPSSGLAARISRSSAPSPPPTSTMRWNRKKWYAVSKAGVVF
jgi:hypothetical protein